ncbi:hypothetical protein BST61_g5052 [Cercospora zeina]
MMEHTETGIIFGTYLSVACEYLHYQGHKPQARIRPWQYNIDAKGVPRLEDPTSVGKVQATIAIWRWSERETRTESREAFRVRVEEQVEGHYMCRTTLGHTNPSKGDWIMTQKAILQSQLRSSVRHPQ